MKTAYTDGACRGGNPGFTSCAWVMYDSALPDQEFSGSKYLGPERHTNNFAEYMGLVLLLEYLYRNNIRNVVIYSDSALVVNQVNQEWQINDVEHRKMAAMCYGLLVQGCHVLKHCDGHSGVKGNERADELCNAMLDIHTEEFNATKPVA